MKPIQYTVRKIEQGTSECMQTSATQLLSFFDPTITVEEVLENVPVYVENGEKIGTAPGHLAAYLSGKGYKVICHIFDVEFFDPTWGSLSPQQVLEALIARQAYIPENSWLAKYHHILIDGWKQHVAAGGGFSFQPLSVKLMYDLLKTAPFILQVNSNYLNRQAKWLYDKESDKFKPDPIRGRTLTHAVTCAGYRDNKFLIIDPEPPANVDQERWIDEDHLVASIMSAQTESDNLLISITKQ